MIFENQEFICEKCKEKKSTEGALLNRDLRINYCICRECRDILVNLIQQKEIETVRNFLNS